VETLLESVDLAEGLCCASRRKAAPRFCSEKTFPKMGMAVREGVINAYKTTEISRFATRRL